jgi:hypothetical protein
MAVKVMWARALRPQAEETKSAAAPLPRAVEERPASSAAKAAKPKRRRSSIFDAEGNEVFITLVCLKCHKTRPLSQFGLRRMADGAIRNQPWCRACRSEASPRKKVAAREETTIPADPSVSADPSGSADAARSSSTPPVAPRDAGLLAAQVAAALHRGRG